MPLTILGLGPGPASLLTQEAAQTLEQASEVYLRTTIHPTASQLPAHLTIHSFDALYESQPTFDAVYSAIVERVWELAQRPEGVLYAVPGHPLIAEATVAQLLRRAQEAGQAVRIIPGLSFVEPALQALSLDPFSPHDHVAAGLQLVDALGPRLEPGRPALVAQVYSRDIASQLKLELLELYPPEHEVAIVTAAGSPEQAVQRVPLAELDRHARFDHLTCVYLPALSLTQNLASFQGLLDIVAKLRAPDGCPWDREQTRQTLKPYLIEEAYEALEAIEQDDLEQLQGELGDLLFNILIQCQVASDAGEFEARDVVRAIAEKLVRRHPHVFGDLKVASAQEVMQNWEVLKSKEREERRSMFEGLPKSLPALAHARSLQERLAPLGLPLARELEQLLAAEGVSQSLVEDPDALGRTLFALAFLSAAKGLNPEEALRQANTAFGARLRRLEEQAWQHGPAGLPDLPADQRRALWEGQG